MQFRFKAFGLHLLGSACALTLVLGGMYLGWYRWPGWYLSSVLHIVGIVLMVDLAIGPTLTLVVANPGKPRNTAQDIGTPWQRLRHSRWTVTLWMGVLYWRLSADWQKPSRPPTCNQMRSRWPSVRTRSWRRTGTACRAGSGRRCRRIRP